MNFILLLLLSLLALPAQAEAPYKPQVFGIGVFDQVNSQSVSTTSLTSGNATLSTPLAVTSGGTGTTTVAGIKTLLTQGLDLIATATASNSATIDFTGLSGTTYSQYVVVVNGLVPATNATDFLMRISTGSGFLTTNYRYGVFRWTNSASNQAGSTSDANFALSGIGETCGTGANQLTSYEININDVNSTYPTKRVMWTNSGLWASSTYVYMSGGGQVDTQSAVVDGISYRMSSGNIASGKFYLFGRRAI